MHYSSLPSLRHELVSLRPIRAGDIAPWFRLLSLPVVYQHTSWSVRDPAELGHYAWREGESTPASLLRFAIALRSSDELVGTAGFHTVSPQNATAEIAYDLAPEHWGKGIATAVCAHLVEWAHGAAAVDRVQATVLETNLRSVKVLERCGFEREGLLRAYRRVRGTPGNFYMYAHVVARRAA